MTKRKQPSERHTLFHEKQKMISHIVWHVATGDWPQKHEVIHHIDEDPFINELSNLQLMTDSEHRAFHMKENTHMKGKLHSKEAKAKMSASQMGNKNHRWLGDSASKHAKYIRKWREKR